MREKQARIQGGVFIWTCAFLFSTSALRSAFIECRSFLELVFVVLMASATGIASCRLCGHLMRMRNNELSVELGPLAGLVCAGMATMITGYFTAKCSARFGTRCFIAFVWTGISILVSCMILFVARGLNARETMFSCNAAKRYWDGMKESAKVACLVLGTIAAIAFANVVFLLLSDGLQLGMWIGWGISIVTSGTVLALLSLGRGNKLVWRVVSRSFLSQSNNGMFFPNDPDSAFGAQTFTLPECLGSVLPGCVLACLLGNLPRLSASSYLMVMLAGMACGVAVTICIYWFDRSHVEELLRAQWRGEATALLAIKHERRVVEHISNMKNRIIDHFVSEASQKWDDESTIREVAEDCRRALNLTLCECASMKYITGYEIADKKDVIGNYVKELFETFVDPKELFPLMPNPNTMNDDQILRLISDVDELNVEESMTEPGIDLYKCIEKLRTVADWSRIRPICIFQLQFKNGKSVYECRMELDEHRNVCLSRSFAGMTAFTQICDAFSCSSALDSYHFRIV